ncbi:hypothetical protein ACQKMD_16600 [Viridibacillus sp. NPDC096237]|uniref:hypothetical protein n=1 Tax=Viridibacillus sp. NPDC096237 TaxID=3390721 RepID=UPI003CFFC771
MIDKIQIADEITQQKIKGTVDAIKVDVSAVKTDVGNVNTNVNTVKNDVSAVKSQATAIQTAVTNLSSSNLPNGTFRATGTRTGVGYDGPVSISSINGKGVLTSVETAMYVDNYVSMNVDGTIYTINEYLNGKSVYIPFKSYIKFTGNNYPLTFQALYVLL